MRSALAIALAGGCAVAGCGMARAPRSPGSPGPAAASSWSPSGAPAAHPMSPPIRPGTGNASGFAVLSMTFVSDTTGFALGTAGCGTRRCAALLGTSDGGVSWHRLAAPARAAAASYGRCPAGSPCVEQVRFATPLIGYAFDPSLLITTDGGRHWRQLAGNGVGSLEAAGGTVVRVASGTQGCSGALSRVESAPVGSDSWRLLPAPPIYLICPPVLYRQGSRLVLAGYGNPAGGVRATARIDRSGDAGHTWAAGSDSCGGKDGYASAVALAPLNVLVELCQHQMPGPSGQYAPAWLRVSVSGGTAFGPGRLIPSMGGVPSGIIIRYQLTAASPGRLLVVETGEHGSQVLLTEDAGRTWSATARMTSPAPVLLVGYEDPLTARIAQASTVWTTTDGGQSWRAHSMG